MSTESKIININDPIRPTELKCDIRFEKVSFSYDTKTHLFDELSMEIPFGSSIGIVGDTGSGKTTIAKLLLRLYEPNEGKIYLGQNNINELDIDYLRAKIGIVSQESFLFNSSIRDNICYGLSDHSHKDLELAARQSQSYEFIEKLPNGFDTIIGERGQTISGGQRQRIAIARTLMRKPDVIIFDEATSSVDNRTEELIQRALFTISEGRTSIIIAHRLSTIRNCSNILVLKDGIIVEEGTHDSLVSDSSTYYSTLWNIQTGKKVKA